MIIKRDDLNYSAALESISATLTSSLELEDILRKTCQIAVETFHIDHSGLVLFDLELKQGSVQGEYPVWGLVGRIIPLMGVPTEEFLVKSKKPLMVADVSKQKDLGPIRNILLEKKIRSILFVPVVSKGRVLGSFSLDVSTAPRKFTNQEIKFCKVIAKHVAIAIENARLFEQSKKDLYIASNFYETSVGLDSSHDPNHSLQLISESIKKTLGALSVSITALDKAGRPYEKAHTGYEEKQQFVRSYGLSSIVMITGKPYIIPDVTRTKEKVNPGMLKSGVKAAICLPLRAQGKKVGVMWITYAQPHHFADTEIKLLGLQANQAGALIETVRLFRERQLLLDTSKMVSSAQDLDTSLQTLAKMMIVSLSATFCRISILDDSGLKLTTRAAYPVIKNLQWDGKVGFQYPVSDSEEESLTIRTGHPQILQKGKTTKLLSSLEQKTNFQGGLKAAVLIPLLVGDTVFGVITLGERRNWERGSFTLERIGLCQSIADQVATLIARMRLEEQAKKEFENLQRLYEASSRVGSTIDPDKTLQFIVEKACQAVGGWRATVILLDDRKRPHRLATTGFDKELVAATSTRPNGISMKVVKTGRPRLFENLNKQDIAANPEMIKDGVRAAICLPLHQRKENIGVLWIHYKEPHKFLPSNIQALKLYASQAAITYDNARQMKELRQLRVAVDAMARVSEPREVLQQIVKGARNVLNADYTVIWSYDHIRNVFIPEELVAENVPQKWLKTFRENEPDYGKTTRKILEDRYIEVSDLLDAPPEYLGKQTKLFLNSLNVRSFQGIRLDVGEEALGVLYVDYKSKRSFSGQERKLLEYFANHASLALKRARLLDQVNKARNAAAVVAQIIALGKDEQKTWNSLVEGAKEALQCDAVTLYRFNEDNGELGYPPAMAGIKFPKKVILLPKVPQLSIIWQTIRNDDLTIIDDTVNDLRTSKRRFTIEEDIKSMIGIPLKAGSRKVGAMFVNYRNKHRFVEDELINIKLFANQIAVAIRNEQLHINVQKRLETLEALEQAGRAITSTLTLNQTLNQIAEQALHIIGVQSRNARCFSHIALFEGDKLPFVAAHPKRMLKVLKNKFNIDLNTSKKIGIVGRAAKTGNSQNLGNVIDDEDYIKADRHTKSQLSIPIKVGEKVIGVLSIEHPNEGAFFEEDVRNVSLLATQAGAAIENARLFNAAEQRAEKLNAILNVSQTTISSLDLNRILTSACKAIVELLNVNHSGLVLFDQNLTIGKIHAEYPDMGTVGLVFPLRGVPIEEQLIKTKIPIMIKNVVVEQGLEPVREIHAKLRTQSILIVPIISKEQILGSFGLDVINNHREFTDDEIMLCEVFAAQVAVAIENARQYEELKQTKGLIGSRTALAWMGMANSTWRHTIEGYAINIRNVITLMRQDAQKVNPSLEQNMLLEKRLQLIESQAVKILEKPITPPLSSEEGLETILINDLVRERLSQLGEDISFSDVSLTMELAATSAKVQISPDWFRRALDILIGNAIDAMSDCEHKNLLVSSRLVLDNVEIVVRDTGRGISPELQEKIFKGQIEKPEGSKGFGMGLLMVEAIMQAYRGGVKLDTSVAGSTTFILYLPLAS